jgi:hypothetical protein
MTLFDQKVSPPDLEKCIEDTSQRLPVSAAIDPG